MKTGTNRNEKERLGTANLQLITTGKSQLSATDRLPRGIRVFSELGRKKPWACQWWLNRKRKSKFFDTKKKAEDFALGLAGDAKQMGVSAFRLDENEAREWRAFRLDLGPDAQLPAVLACWRRFGPKPAPTVAEAVAAFLEAKTGEGIAPDNLLHYRTYLDRFGQIHGKRNAAEITREDASGWLASLPYGAETKRAHFVKLRTFFNWMVKVGKLGASPLVGLRVPRPVSGEVAIYTVAQGRALFAKNKQQSRELLGRLALEAFAGMRFSSAAGISGADIKFAQHGIVLPAANIKTRRRQFVDGLPANLWRWLEWSKPAQWNMTPRQYLEAKSQARVRANLPEVHNALRHSFCSYHIAANKDASRTSVILCHSSPKMLWQHYRGNATEKDGRAWFKITPSPSH